MAFSFVQSKSGATASGTDLTVTYDSGPTENNLLVAFASFDGITAIADPDGWENIHGYARAANYWGGAWYKIAGASEGSGVLFDGAGTEAYVGHIYEFSGIDTGDALDQNQTDNDFGSPWTNAGSLTPALDNSLLFGAVQWYQGSTYTATMDGLLTSPEGNTTSGSGVGHVGLDSGYEIQTTATARNFSHTGSGSISNIVSLIIFNPSTDEGTNIPRVIHHLQHNIGN